MEKLIERWIAESEGYRKAENDTVLAFHARAMAKHKKEVFKLCSMQLREVCEREREREGTGGCAVDIAVDSILTCVFGDNDEITEDRDYKVLDIDETYVLIRDDSNSEEWICKFFFKIKEKQYC